MKKKETLTILFCVQCQEKTGHRVFQRDDFPDRTEVIFACTVCESQMHRTKEKPIKKMRQRYYLEITNWNDIIYVGTQGKGIIHKDKDCVSDLRETHYREGENPTFKIGRGAWVEVECTHCERCYENA